MQTRTSFNGGELSPEMEARCDVDAYMRGCRTLENWEVSTTGGVKRRRGMRDVTAALGGDSRLVAYEYTHATAGGVYLVELGADVVRVLDYAGQELARFESRVGGTPEFFIDLQDVRTQQLNALLVITSRNNWPLVLRWDGAAGWSLKRMEFKSLPWRYDFELRKHPIELVATQEGSARVYSVLFHDEEDTRELPLDGREDSLRASFFVEQAEAGAPGETVRWRVWVSTAFGPETKGARIAVKGDEVLTYWVCKQEFPADVYVAGLDDPGSYPDNFEKSENVSDFDGVREVTSVKALGTVAKGTKFAMRAGYWEYFTCIRNFTYDDMVEGVEDYAEYPGFFVRGIAVGDALPCKGKWSFYCSGLWYGSYEVIRGYDGSELSDEWETAGISFSRLNDAENVQLAGDERDEECWLRLMLTRSKRLSDNLEDGFPPDSCGNRLVVDGYKHTMVLRLDPYGVWSCVDTIDIGWTGRRVVKDWSWAAFSERYGYPLECEVFQQRLVFASTAEQPQSLWMSRVDDLYNFATGDSDDAAIYLTLYTMSQNPICWMLEDRGRLMLGTSNAEWVLEARDGVVTPASLQVTRHGRVGSQGGVMLAAEDKALYVGRGGSRVWEFGYSFEVDGCRSSDLTIFAAHVLRDHGGVRSATLVRKPDTVAVFVLEDGQVALMTYNVLHQVHAWHRWVTDGLVRSAVALSDGARGDRLYLVVDRGGAARIEVVDDDSGYVDSAGRPYASVLVTNALGNPLEQVLRKQPKVPVCVLLGHELNADELEVCADGGSWGRLPRAGGVLAAGWHELLLYNRWQVSNAVGMRCSGGACSILALQG